MKIAVRVDSSVQMGSGHIMRCLTLAEALHEKGAEIRFICREHPGNLCDMVESRGFRVARLPLSMKEGSDYAAWLGADWETDAAQTAGILKKWGNVDWLIIDHYAIDSRWESRIRKVVAKIMVIDDLANRNHNCDLLLDQNSCHAGKSKYVGLVPPGCIRLIGPKYALLRPEFGKAREHSGQRGGKVRRIFVFFGGSDQGNETAMALEAIMQLGMVDVAVDVVVGSANPKRKEIEKLCSLMPSAIFHCQVNNMAELMCNADLAIGTGGGVMWERACMGLPSIVMSVADNQCQGSEAFAKNGGILYLGRSVNVDVAVLRSSIEVVLASPYLAHRMKEVGTSTVDGNGTERVACRIMDRKIVLRPARMEDCESIFRWRNAEVSRRYSNNPEPMSFASHASWYEDALSDPDRAIIVAEIEGEPVGVIRYDRKEDRATVSVYLVPGNQGQGLGTQLISEGTRWIAENWQISAIDAFIKTENLASIAAFEAAGFQKEHCIYSMILKS